ncbi:transcription factor HES-2-like [Chanos chanos]|uniref:Transcription factor HES-2-like n=1 Tax=Chanos chanos TaxID=29144 RepID=A0A6J2WB62_CHACN|nr:transcription factor HES-2-like [Chanos chanos]
MTPNIINESTNLFGSRSTVAQRKEASELRKTLKPLMEKRRRARINESLNQLKTLILPLVGKDNSRYSKLEKADILEMTVRFLRELPSSPVKSQNDSYKEGYKACLQRVSALLPQTSLDKDTCHRVNDFIRQSMAATTTACQNCCAQSSRVSPPLQQRLLNLKPTSPRTENHTGSAIRPIPIRPQPVPQVVSANMWRPW